MNPIARLHLRAHRHTPERQQGPLLGELRRLDPSLASMTRDELARVLRRTRCGRAPSYSREEQEAWCRAVQQGVKREAIQRDPDLNPRGLSLFVVSSACRGLPPVLRKGAVRRPPVRPHADRRPTPEERERWVDAARRGITRPAIHADPELNPRRLTLGMVVTVLRGVQRANTLDWMNSPPTDLPVRRHQNGRTTPELRARILELYAQDVRPRHIARMLGVTYSRVMTVCPTEVPPDVAQQVRDAWLRVGYLEPVARECGVHVRHVRRAIGLSGNGNPRHFWARQMAPVWRAEHAAGRSLRAIGRHYRVSLTTIRAAIGGAP